MAKVTRDREKAEAKRLGLQFGDAHPITGKIWSSSYFTSPEGFEYDRRKQMIHRAAARARRDGDECSLTYEWLDSVWPADGMCPVFPSIRLEWGRQNWGNSPTLDKIVPANGYHPGNCCVMSMRANRLKSFASLEELRLMAAWSLTVS